MTKSLMHQEVEVYLVQFEDIFEQTGRKRMLIVTGRVMKETETYLVIQDEINKLHFVSLAKYEVISSNRDDAI